MVKILYLVYHRLRNRFVLGFHLLPHRNSSQAFALLNFVKPHSSLNSLTPAQVAEVNLTERESTF